MADSTTALLQIIDQETGNNDSTWGDIANSNFNKLEVAIAGQSALSLGGGGVTLTDDQARPSTFILTGGTVTTFTVPARAKFWTAVNAGTATAFFKVAGFTPTVRVPVGRTCLLICDGTTLRPIVGGPKVGSIIIKGGTTLEVDELACDGAAYSRTDYFELFAKVGTTFGVGDGSTTFNVPNLIDRYPRGASGTYAAGQVLADQLKGHAHGLTIDGVGNHTHVADGVGDHTHAVAGGLSTTSPALHPLISVNDGFATSLFATNAAGAHTHNIEGSGAHSHTGTVAASGSETETRPASAVFTMAIQAF